MWIAKADGVSFEEIDDRTYLADVEKAALARIRAECEAKGAKFSPNSPAVRHHVGLMVAEAMDEASICE